MWVRMVHITSSGKPLLQQTGKGNAGLEGKKREKRRLTQGQTCWRCSQRGLHQPRLGRMLHTEASALGWCFPLPASACAQATLESACCRRCGYPMSVPQVTEAHDSTLRQSERLVAALPLPAPACAHGNALLLKRLPPHAHAHAAFRPASVTGMHAGRTEAVSSS